MGGYANFLKRMNAGGITLREEQIENAQRHLQQTFADDPSYQVNGCPVWYSERILHPRIYDYTWKSTLPAQASFQTELNEPVYLGDVLHWNEENGYWMCIGVTNLHGINWEGTLQFCNFWLKFRSPITGEIRKYPISMYNATQYGTGEDAKTRMTIGSSAHIIYLTCDEHTMYLDNGCRFLIDKNLKVPTAYKLTQMDTSSYAAGQDKGFLRMYVLEDQYNPKTDDAENMLADAWEDKVGNGTELKDNNDSWL